MRRWETGRRQVPLSVQTSETNASPKIGAAPCSPAPQFLYHFLSSFQGQIKIQIRTGILLYTRTGDLHRNVMDPSYFRDHHSRDTAVEVWSWNALSVCWILPDPSKTQSNTIFFWDGNRSLLILLSQRMTKSIFSTYLFNFILITAFRLRLPSRNLSWKSGIIHNSEPSSACTNIYGPLSFFFLPLT